MGIRHLVNVNFICLKYVVYNFDFLFITYRILISFQLHECQGSNPNNSFWKGAPGFAYYYSFHYHFCLQSGVHLHLILLNLGGGSSTLYGLDYSIPSVLSSALPVKSSPILSSASISFSILSSIFLKTSPVCRTVKHSY